MGHGISILAAIMTGLLLTTLSCFLLKPFFRNAHDIIKGLRSENFFSIFKRILALFAVALLIFTGTFSIKTAIIAGTIPPFLWYFSVFFKMKTRKKLRKATAKELPLLLDYLVLQVESGHSIQQSIRSAPRLFPGGSQLRFRLNELDSSMQVGSPMVKALEDFGLGLDTPEAETPILAISQAIQHGTPLVKILREQSKRMTENLVLEGEQFANIISVKILIPLLFFIFPASFLVIFSPVIVSLSGMLP